MPPSLHGYNELALAPGPDGRAQSAECLNPTPSPRSARTPGSDEDPIHRRSVTMDVFTRGDHVVAIATLRDERPWASG